MNSEEFREAFLRNDREGPTKSEMAGKKEAKQKAGPSGIKRKEQRRNWKFHRNEEHFRGSWAKISPKRAEKRSTQGPKRSRGTQEPEYDKKETSEKSGDDGQATQEEPRGWGVAAPD